MGKTYKNDSGTFSESEMVVAIWSNPKKEKARPNARPLETITDDKSPYPVAFPLEMLQTIQSWMYCEVAKSVEDIEEVLFRSKATRQKPLLVPLHLAKSYLGWEIFYIPSRYKEVN